MSRYLVFLLGGVWGCLLSSLVQDTIFWMTIGFVIGVFGAAFAFASCEIIMDAHKNLTRDIKPTRQNGET